MPRIRPLDNMLSRFFFGFIPTVQYDNSIKTRRATFLSIILPITLIALLIIIVSQVIDRQIPAPVLGANILAGILGVGLSYWVHRVAIARGGLIFLLLVFLYITIAIATVGTVRNPAIAGYLFFITSAGILFDRQGMGLAFILSVLAVLGLIGAEANGLVRPAGSALLMTQWQVYAALLILFGGVIFWAFQILWQALARVDRQMAELESSPAAIIITDTDGQIEYVNPKYTQMMGDTLEHVRGTRPPFFQPEQMPPATYSKLWDVLLAGHVWHGEFQNQTKNGELFLASYSITPITHAPDQIMHFVIIMKDVSERKRVEAEHRALNRTREFATLYEITHDLGTFTELPTLFDTLLTRAASLLNIYAGAIYLLDAERREFILVSEIGIPVPRGAPIPHTEWLADHAPKIHAGFPPVIHVPIRYGEECLGRLVLTMVGSGRSDSDKPNLNLLVLMATQIASAMHNLRMLEQVRASRARAQVLAKEVLSAQESERRSISRELHDEFGQELTSVQLGLQRIAGLVNQPPVQTKLHDIMGTVEHVLSKMRDLSRGLRPTALDDFGLVPALEWLVEQQIKRGALHAEVIADASDERLPEDVETVCFRVAQEALTNVVRHGQATRVVIELHLADEQLELTVHDNGIGFDLSTAMQNVTQGNSLGLLNMHERIELVGGKMQITTAPGQGTRIHAWIPLNPQAPNTERRLRPRSSR